MYSIATYITIDGTEKDYQQNVFLISTASRQCFKSIWIHFDQHDLATLNGCHLIFMVRSISMI